MHFAILTQLGMLVATSMFACDQAPGSSGASGGNSSLGGSATTGGRASDGGGSEQTPCGSASVEDGFVDVKASDTGIRYIGRLDFSKSDAPRMAFPAVAIETRFEGDAIDMRIQEKAGGGATTTPYYEITIDSEPPIRLKTCSGREVYPLARGLTQGMHTVRIAKRTEASVGTATFLGFRVRPNTSLTRPDTPRRLLEFVGDSITCGYGNEISTDTPDEYKFTSVNENALAAYGALTARELSADYVAVAISGRGMVRNYSGGSGLTGPKYYELSGAEASWPAWDHTRYSPDVIVVNLGTNDFSPGLSVDQLGVMRGDYRQTYAEFLVRLRQLHPHATLIAAVGPMINDSHPEGYTAWTSIRSDVQSIVDARVVEGDSNVFYLAFDPQVAPYGEDWHPTIATHEQLAGVLSTFIKEKKSW